MQPQRPGPILSWLRDPAREGDDLMQRLQGARILWLAGLAALAVQTAGVAEAQPAIPAEHAVIFSTPLEGAESASESIKSSACRADVTPHLLGWADGRLYSGGADRRAVLGEALLDAPVQLNARGHNYGSAAPFSF